MVFARRGYNVQSLAVGPAETPGDSRITMVVPATKIGMSTMMKHVLKLVCVKEVVDITAKPYVARELMLVKVRGRGRAWGGVGRGGCPILELDACTGLVFVFC